MFSLINFIWFLNYYSCVTIKINWWQNEIRLKKKVSEYLLRLIFSLKGFLLSLWKSSVRCQTIFSVDNPIWTWRKSIKPISASNIALISWRPFHISYNFWTTSRPKQGFSYLSNDVDAIFTNDSQYWKIDLLSGG